MKDRSRKLAVINTGRKPQTETGVATTTVVHSGVSGVGSSSMNLSDYLLKQIWDKAFEIRVTETGEEYLFGKLNFATQYGITMYANGGLLDLPSIFKGIPFDNKTIWLNPETKLVEVIGSTEKDEGGSADFNNVKESGEGNSFTSFILSEDGKELTFVKGETFAKQSDFASLNTKVADFLEGSDTDNIINKWKELEAFLSGMKESDDLATILATKWTKDDAKIANWDTAFGWGDHSKAGYAKSVDVISELKKYVTLSGTQTITGEKNFTGGLKVDGSPIVYNATSKYWKLEGDLLVTGGVTMFGNDSAFSPSTITQAVNVDGTTIINDGKKLMLNPDIQLGGGGVTDYNDLTNKPNLSVYALKSSLDEVVELLDGYLPLKGGTITGNVRLRAGSEHTSPYLYFGDGEEVWMKEATDTHLTIHADGSVKIDSPKTVIDGIEIKKSASGVLYIGGDLVVSGGITMYGTDGTSAPSIWDGAPKATTTNKENGKGIASFDSKYFSVTNGHVTFIGPTGGGGIDSITKQMVIDALGFTPYDEDNPDGFITGITKSMVTTALGYTPYNSTNPSGFITGITKSMVTTALGFTPYNATNPNGYITSSGSITGNAATATTLKTSRTIWGQSFNGSGNVSGNLKLGSSNLLMESDNSYGDSIWSIFAYGPTLQFKHGSAGGSASNMGLQISRTNNQVTTYGSILPSTNLSYNLGSADAKWYNICGAYVYGYNALYVGSSDYFLSTFTNGLQIGTYSLFRINQNGTIRLQMNASGNFGIGTTSPQSKLHVVGTVQADTAFQLPTVDNAFTGGNLLWKLSSTTYGRLGTNTSGDMGIYARNSVVIRGGATGSNAPTTGMEIDKDGVSFIKSNKAYGVMVKRLNSSGGAYTKYLPCNQESKSWAAGVNNTYQFSWWYQSGSSDTQKMYLDSSGNLLTTGGITMYSDIRKKTILNHVELSLKEVADAPLIEHYYNSDEKKTTHVGSVAQYWAELNDWFCKEDEEGFLTMEIQNAALASAISVARELTRYESKTDKQIKKLKKRIGELEDEIETLKKV